MPRQELLTIGPQFFFSIANRPKSHFLFHNNAFLRDIYVMTFYVGLVIGGLGVFRKSRLCIFYQIENFFLRSLPKWPKM